MDTTSVRRPRLPTSTSPAAQIGMLIGRDHDAFLSAALEPSGGTLLSSRPRQVFQQPRSGAIASYDTQVRWPDGSMTHETLVACNGDLPKATLVVDNGSEAVAVWRFPHDPDLPGLASAHGPRAAGRLLSELGLGGEEIRLRVRAYRPRRRAVISVTGTSGELFIKAVRRHRVKQLHDRHRMLVRAGVPAPHSLGWTDGGLLVLQALPGPTMRQAIRAGQPLPSGESIVELLDRLPLALLDAPARRSWLDRVEHHAAVAAAIMPTDAQRVARIADSIRNEASAGPTVPVHGDFYESQLLVDGRSITGLLDVDGAGPGDRLDDLACLLGHLSVLAAVDRQHARRINAVGAEYLAVFQRTVDAAELRYRTAAVVVSLIAGPHRVQDRQWPATTRRLIDLADRWLTSARGRGRP